MVSLEFIIFSIIIDSVGVGAIYAIGAAALSMEYGSTKVPDVALSTFLVLGAYMVLYLDDVLGLGYIPAVVVGFISFLPVYLLIDRLVLRKYYDHPDAGIIFLVITVGIFTALNGLYDTVLSQNSVILTTPYQNFTFSAAGLNISGAFVLYLVAEYSLLGGLLYFARYTRYGMALRAMAQNRRAAALMGVNTQRSSTVAYVISSSVASLAGMLYALAYSFDPSLGPTLNFVMFSIVFVGGAGSIIGAVLIGVAFGVIESVVTFLVSPLLTPFFFYSILFIVLFVKPEGIFTR